MATIKDERIHVDEYSCTLCESRSGVSLKCCCPDNPEDLFQVTEEHFRRRISLKHDQKLCQEHVKKLKSGLLFGRTDWYECCAPFHVKSPQSPKLRPIPHSWKSFFESPSNNKRYHSQQRICWDCYLLAMEVINSGLDDGLDEDAEDYQSTSFDLGYTSPKRWASNLSLQHSNSPSGSQAGSTWSLAVQQGSLASKHRNRNMSDATNSLSQMGKRARISHGKFMTPSRSFDLPSARDRNLRVPRQASDATNSLQLTQRNLNDELNAASADDSLSLGVDMEEPASFQSDDFISIPVFTTTPHETLDQSDLVGNSGVHGEENVPDLQPGKKGESTGKNAVSTAPSAGERAVPVVFKTEYEIEKATSSISGTSESKLETDEVALAGEENLSDAAKTNNDVSDRTPKREQNFSSEPKNEPDIGQANQTSELNMTSASEIRPKPALDANEYNNVHPGLSKFSQPTSKSLAVTNKIISSHLLLDEETGSTSSDFPTIVVSENTENFVQDEPIIARTEKLQDHSSQSCSDNEDIASSKTSTIKSVTAGKRDQTKSLSDQKETSNVILKAPNELREINQRQKEIEEPTDLSITNGIRDSDSEIENGPEPGKDTKLEIGEGRFDPIICSKGSDSALSDEEGSQHSNISRDSNSRRGIMPRLHDSAFEPREVSDAPVEDGELSSESDFLTEEGGDEIIREEKNEIVNTEQIGGNQNAPNWLTSSPRDEERPEATCSSAELPLETQGMRASQAEKEVLGQDGGVEIEPIVNQTNLAEQTEIGSLPSTYKKDEEFEVPSTPVRRMDPEQYIPSKLSIDAQGEAYASEGEEILPYKQTQEEEISVETTQVVSNQRPTFTREFSSSSNEESDDVSSQKPIVNGISDGDNDSSGTESQFQLGPQSPIGKDLSQESMGEMPKIAAKTKLYTELHGSKAETGSSSEKDDEKSEEEVDERGKHRSESAPNVIRTLRSDNRADDGERLQFLRRRMGNRSCSVAAPPSDRGFGENARKSTSALRTKGQPLNRRSMSQDKRRKFGVTFALDPRQSIVIDETPALEKILQRDEASKEEFPWERKKTDSSEIFGDRSDSDHDEDDEREKRLAPKKEEDFSPKREELSSPSEDEDVSSVLADIFQNVFTMKMFSELIQSLNSGSSVQVLVMTLLSVIVILLILLAIFVFVL